VARGLLSAGQQQGEATVASGGRECAHGGGLDDLIAFLSILPSRMQATQEAMSAMRFAHFVSTVEATRLHGCGVGALLLHAWTRHPQDTDAREPEGLVAVSAACGCIPSLLIHAQLHLSKGHFSVVSKKAEFLLKTESGYLRDAKML